MICFFLSYSAFSLSIISLVVSEIAFCNSWYLNVPKVVSANSFSYIACLDFKADSILEY